MKLNILHIDSRRDDIAAAMAELRRRLSPEGNVVSEAGRKRTLEVFGQPLSPVEVVQRICRDVKAQGLAAVLDYSRRIDKAELAPGRAFACRSRNSIGPMRRPIRNSSPPCAASADGSRIFNAAILQRDVRLDVPNGYLQQRCRPLRRVGICVPGGAAAYPSTVLMTAVPAQVAGVAQLAVVAPPTAFGAFNPDLLATCRELDITEVYRLGGAQAVAALAYGVEGIPRVDKIVGPGNLFVALAKRHVYGEVDIDSIAGPSEVVVIVDRSTRPEYTAADLIAQAEHAPGASILIGWDEGALAGRGGRAWPPVGRPGAGRACPAEPRGVRRGHPGPRRRRGLRLADDDRPGAPAHRHATTPSGWPSGFRTPGRSSWAISPPWPWATMRPGPRTCCPPAARPGLPAGCRPTPSCAAPASFISPARA